MSDAENEQLRARIEELEEREALWREYEAVLRNSLPSMLLLRNHGGDYRKRLGIEREEDR